MVTDSDESATKIPQDISDSTRKRSDSPPPSKNRREERSRDRSSKRHRSADRSSRRSNDNNTKRKHSRDRSSRDDDYPRYYGEDAAEGQHKRNSDRYWTKYPKKDDDYQIGSRYYGDKNDEASKANKSSRDRNNSSKSDAPAADKSVITPRERKTVDILTSRTGGAYIPPAKLRLMQAEITDKSSAAYQRIAWEALKKSIHGFINKVNTSNIGIISRQLLHENIVRGRGLLSKSIIQAQAASPTFTNVYAALVAVINSKFPNIGELLLRRLVLQFKRGFKQNNKIICISATTFVAHLVNQRVAHEILALEILTLLVESPTDDSVEVAISFLKECGQKLTEVTSKGINAIFEMLRNILHEGQLEQRIQYMIEVMFQVRKDGFKDHVAITEELDLVEEEDQFTHLITLDDVKQVNSEDILNVFKFDDKYEENEGKYKTLSKEILGSDSESGSEDDEDGSDEDSNAENDDDDETKKQDAIIDNTETNLIALRRTIYLTIQSSLDFEECAHKLMKMELKPGQELELCHMFLDCCAEQRTYEKFYGLLAQRFCQVNKVYVEPFQQIFKDTYATTHRLDANKLRNVSKFFAHLMFTDAIGWEVLDIMKLNEEDTNSSSRIFIKILFQELAEYMGLEKLNGRLKDETLQSYFAGLFPRDNPKNTRFSINFFTSIGLGGLTAELREHLKFVPKVVNTPVNVVVVDEESSSSSSNNSAADTGSSSEDSGSSDSSSSSSSENDGKKKKSSKKSIKLSKDQRTDKKKEKKKKKQSAGKHDDNDDDSSSSDKDKKKKKKLRRNESSKVVQRRDEEDKERQRRGRRHRSKDYEWIKSRVEDDLEQLKSQRNNLIDNSRSYSRSRQHRVKDERSRDRKRSSRRSRS